MQREGGREGKKEGRERGRERKGRRKKRKVGERGRGKEEGRKEGKFSGCFPIKVRQFAAISEELAKKPYKANSDVNQVEPTSILTVIHQLPYLSYFLINSS